MAAVADVRRRVLMVSGAIDAIDHDVSVTIDLPEAGRWQVIKSETNLTDRTWVAMQVTTDEDTHLVDDADAMVVSRQFAKSFMTPDRRRLSCYEGEVRPGEAVLSVFSVECGASVCPMPNGGGAAGRLGIAVGRRLGRSWPAAPLSGAVNGAFGVVIVLLETLLH